MVGFVDDGYSGKYGPPGYAENAGNGEKESRFHVLL